MKLTISEPCHLSWDSMTPSGSGRYCGSCNKVVIDFTRMNDEELKNYFIHHTAASTCGRLKTEQSNNTLPEHARRVWSWHAVAREKIRGKYPRVATLFVIGLLLVLMGCKRRMVTRSHGSIRFLEDEGPVPVAAGKTPSTNLQKADS
jgi:hypothetical protein